MPLDKSINKENPLARLSLTISVISHLCLFGLLARVPAPAPAPAQAPRAQADRVKVKMTYKERSFAKKKADGSGSKVKAENNKSLKKRLPRPKTSISEATRSFLATGYAQKLSELEKKIHRDLLQEEKGRPIAYDGFASLLRAARFFRFHLDIPYGLLQRQKSARVEARLAKNTYGQFELRSMRGDPFFGVPLHRALLAALKENEVQQALSATKFHTVLVYFRYLKADKEDIAPVDAALPPYYAEGHTIYLQSLYVTKKGAILHLKKTECIDDKQEKCDREVAQIKASKIFKMLEKRAAQRPAGSSYFDTLKN